MNINELGNGIGLLYATTLDGEFVIPGIPNDVFGVETIKRHAQTRSPIGYTISAQGSIQIDQIALDQILTNITINGVNQVPTSTIALTAFDEDIAATDIANAVNLFTPVSGVNYQAVAVGDTVYFQAPQSSGESVNGDVIVMTTTDAPNITLNITNIEGGSTGEGLISQINGAKYYLNSTNSATIGSLVGAEEISRYVIARGTESQIPTVTQQIASQSVTDLERYGQIQVLELGSSGVSDLDSINGDFAIHDILIIRNKSAFTVTLNDLSVNAGNLKINPTTFGLIDDSYVIWMQYVEDSVDGLVWKEIYRNPITLGVNAVTDVELADNSVDTLAIQNLATTTSKIANGAITAPKMAVDAVLTPSIFNLAVTTEKINDLAVTSDKIALNAVDTPQINDEAVTTPKIADGSITLDKLSVNSKTESFTMPISWEIDEQGIVKRKMPHDGIVTEIFLSVSKGVEATDDATVIFKNDAGTAMTAGQIDVPAGDPIGNDFTSTPSANNVFSAGEAMQFETIKTNPGGKAVVTVCYTRS